MSESFFSIPVILAMVLLTVGLVGMMSRSNRASTFFGMQIAMQSAALIWCAGGAGHRTATGQVGGLLVLGAAAAICPVVAVLFMKGLSRDVREIESVGKQDRTELSIGLQRADLNREVEEAASAEQG